MPPRLPHGYSSTVNVSQPAQPTSSVPLPSWMSLTSPSLAPPVSAWPALGLAPARPQTTLVLVPAPQEPPPTLSLLISRPYTAVSQVLSSCVILPRRTFHYTYRPLLHRYIVGQRLCCPRHIHPSRWLSQSANMETSPRTVYLPDTSLLADRAPFSIDPGHITETVMRKLLCPVNDQKGSQDKVVFE